MLNAELDLAQLKGWDNVIQLVIQLARQGERAMRGKGSEHIRDRRTA